MSHLRQTNLNHFAPRRAANDDVVYATLAERSRPYWLAFKPAAQAPRQLSLGPEGGRYDIDGNVQAVDDEPD
jgi:hypothetical protein